MIQLLSDKNCDRKKCNLQLGSSNAFVLNARRRRLDLKYHGTNYLRRIFSSRNGIKILQKCEQGIKERYSDVLNGKRRTLITSPPQFDYNTRMKDTATIVEAGLEKIIENKFYKDVEELNDINKFRAIYLPQAGERDVFSPLLSCFFHHRGLFIHGFEPSKYLNVFVTQAENMRNEDMSKGARIQTNSWMKVIINLELFLLFLIVRNSVLIY